MGVHMDEKEIESASQELMLEPVQFGSRKCSEEEKNGLTTEGNGNEFPDTSPFALFKAHGPDSPHDVRSDAESSAILNSDSGVAKPLIRTPVRSRRRRNRRKK